MMVEDLGIEAKEAAVREVAKLLPLPELLQSISSIKSDYMTRQQVHNFFSIDFIVQIEVFELNLIVDLWFFLEYKFPIEVLLGYF